MTEITKNQRSGTKGKRTRENIINVAREVLANEGYEGFVLRQIAAKTGVKPGNLQYYFSSKKDLLQAVLENELHRYQDTYGKVAEDKHGKTARILSIVDFLLDEIKNNKATSNIWYTVWALAPLDPEIAELMDVWYQQYMEKIKEVFKSAAPDLSDSQAGHIASILTALMDGLTNQIGYGKTPHAIHEGIESTIRSLILDLVES